MALKCYDIKYLRQYHSNEFIHERIHPFVETTFNYQTICDYVEKVIQYFKDENIATNIGIAVNVSEHSVDSFILLLSILNYNCYIYAFNDDTTLNTFHNIETSRVSYVCTKNPLKVNSNKQTLQKLKDLKIVTDSYTVLKLNSIKEQLNVPCCYVINTSGSTGIPKVVFVPYKCLEPNIKNLSSFLGITSNDIIYIASPATFDPFMVEFFLALENGCALIITSHLTRFMADNFIDKYSTEMKLRRGATILQTTPSLFRLFGKENIQNILLNEIGSLRCLLLGGEDFPSPQELMSWLPKSALSSGKYRKKIYNIYGITEISCWSCMYEFKINQHLANEPVPLGKMLDDDITLRIVNENGEVLHSSDNCSYVEGELEIGGINRKCYMDNDIPNEEDQVVFRCTGDLVCTYGNDNIYYQGRLKNTIKRLGKRLCLDMLAGKTKNLLKTKDLNVDEIVCLWDKENIKLVFVIKGYPNSLIPLVLKKCLENYEQPDQFCYIEEIPLTYHGKVNRVKLMEHVKNMNKLKSKTPLEIFCEFLQNVLGLDKCFEHNINQDSGIIQRVKNISNCNFMQLGGSSYQALSLATEIANHMTEANDQRLILKMLLDKDISLKQIHNFLGNVNHVDSAIVKNTYVVREIVENSNSFQQIRLNLLWRVNLLKCVDANPSLNNKVVAVGSHSHLLLVVDVETGKILSELQLPDRIECSVTFLNDSVAVIGCYNNYLYIFNYRSGIIQKEISCYGLIKAKPLLIAEKDLLLVASYGELYNVTAICLKTFGKKWSIKLGSKSIYASPIKITANIALLCTLDGTCGWLNVVDGKILIQRKFDSPIFSTPVLIQTSKEKFVALAEVCGKISICKVDSGVVLYNFQASGNIFSSFAVHYSKSNMGKDKEEDNIILVFGCYDHNVYFLNFQSQAPMPLSLMKKVSCESTIYATPILVHRSPSDSYALVCTTNGRIILLNLINTESKPLELYNLQAEIFSTPCCYNNVQLFLGCRDNFLYAFEIDISN